MTRTNERALIRVGRKESEHVTIAVVSYEPDGWRVTTVEVACGIWKGTFTWNFYRGELRRFAESVQTLYRTLSGTAVLQPLEPNIALRLSGDGRGHVLVDGRADADCCVETCLAFRIALDQTDLPEIVSALYAADPA